MIKIIIKLLKALSSDITPNSLALAVCMASIIGLTPLLSPHNLLILFIVLFFRIHLSTFILALAGFSILGLLLDPLFDQFGYYLLTAPLLTDLWTMIYNVSIGRLSQFNNSIIIGSLSFSLLLFFPLYFTTISLVIRYRDTFMVWLENSKIMVLLKSSNLFKMYVDSSENSL